MIEKHQGKSCFPLKPPLNENNKKKWMEKLFNFTHNSLQNEMNYKWNHLQLLFLQLSVLLS